ncbi:MAG: PEP-CTERM sorting domain-containing protein [Pseudomonadota bacterium]
MTTRPVPLRIAGYNPVAPVETGRVPAPLASQPPVPAPAFPPENPVYWPDDFFGPPPPYVPPVLIPPPPIPCDDDDDTPNPDCPPGPPGPEEPPMEVPEPGVIVILLAGLGAYWLSTRRR